MRDAAAIRGARAQRYRLSAHARVSPRRSPRPLAAAAASLSHTRYPQSSRTSAPPSANGWPKVLIINRPGATARRTRLLARFPRRKGLDRDEYPPAMLRGRGGRELTRGTNLTGWRA